MAVVRTHHYTVGLADLPELLSRRAAVIAAIRAAHGRLALGHSRADARRSRGHADSRGTGGAVAHPIRRRPGRRDRRRTVSSPALRRGWRRSSAATRVTQDGPASRPARRPQRPPRHEGQSHASRGVSHAVTRKGAASAAITGTVKRGGSGRPWIRGQSYKLTGCTRDDPDNWFLWSFQLEAADPRA
jgi:hypothetical protein